MSSESIRSIAIFRVEGVLLRRTALGCAARLAAGHRDFGNRFAGLALGLLARPIDAMDSAMATRLAWRGLSGCSHDRVHVLGDLYWNDRLDEAWNPTGLDLLDRCRERGDRIVLLSDHPDAALGDLQARLRADRLICNHLEIADGRATGRLVDPVFTGRADGSLVRRLASEVGADPARALAYGCGSTDATLLSGVPFPCAVTPDLRLHGLATSFDWPIVEA